MRTLCDEQRVALAQLSARAEKAERALADSQAEKNDAIRDAVSYHRLADTFHEECAKLSARAEAAESERDTLRTLDIASRKERDEWRVIWARSHTRTKHGHEWWRTCACSDCTKARAILSEGK
jgi:hypothetical protein